MEPGYRDIFTLKGIQTFPDGNRYLILEDAKGYRFLQDYKPYAGYGLKPGTKITCRVDKVNCNGKIFLEPAHPWFEEGKYYEVPVIYRKNLTTCALLIGVDPGGDRHLIFTTLPTDLPTAAIQVISISKGKVLMEPADPTHRPPLPESHEMVEALWEEIVSDELAGKALAILLRGPIPLVAPLRCMPESYNPGDRVKCIVRKGNRWIEPANPFITPGTTVRLSYLETLTKPDLLRGPKNFILASDESGQKHEILVSSLQVLLLRPGDPVFVKIKSFKCGKPVWELASNK